MYITYFGFWVAGIEWSLDNDASNAAVLVASEAHAISLAIEGLLGVVFTVASLTDEAVDAGEVSGNISCLYIMFYAMQFLPNFIFSWYKQLESPRCDYVPSAKCGGKTAVLCISMVDSLWLTILDALSLILARFADFFFQCNLPFSICIKQNQVCMCSKSNLF